MACTASTPGGVTGARATCIRPRCCTNAKKTDRISRQTHAGIGHSAPTLALRPPCFCTNTRRASPGGWRCQHRGQGCQDGDECISTHTQALAAAVTRAAWSASRTGTPYSRQLRCWRPELLSARTPLARCNHVHVQYCILGGCKCKCKYFTSHIHIGL